MNQPFLPQPLIGNAMPRSGGIASMMCLPVLSPPSDPLGNTALTAANIAFELLRILPGYTDHGA